MIALKIQHLSTLSLSLELMKQMRESI